MGTPAWDGDISLGWGHQYGKGVLSIRSHHHDDPPLPCCWQMGDSSLSPSWDVHWVAAGDSCLLSSHSPWYPMQGEKQAVTEVGPHGWGSWDHAGSVCHPMCPQGNPSSCHQPVPTEQGRPQALTQPRGVPPPRNTVQGAGTCRGSWWPDAVTRLMAGHGETEARAAGRWQIANSHGSSSNVSR